MQFIPKSTPIQPLLRTLLVSLGLLLVVIYPNSAKAVAHFVCSGTSTIAENTTAKTDSGITCVVDTTPASTFESITDDRFDFESDGTNAQNKPQYKVVLKANQVVDYEVITGGVLTITITVKQTVAGTVNRHTAIVMITITDDSNEVHRTGTQASFDEEDATTSDTDTGYSFTYEAGGSPTFSLGGTGSSNFKFSSGKLQVNNGVTFDYETKSHYTITITATAGSNTATNVVIISINEVDEAPVLTKGGSSQDTINEQTVGSSHLDTGFTFTAADEDTNDTARIVLSDSTNFQIGTGNKLQFKSGVVINYEGKDAYTVTVTATSTRGSTTKTDTEEIEITITDVDEAPVISRTGEQFPFGEGTFRSDSNVLYYYTATDPDGDDVSFSVSDTTNFAINSNGTNLRVKSGVSFDYETKSTYTITITASSTGSSGTALHGTDVITISLTDIDEPPELTKSGTSQNAINEQVFASDTDTGFSFTAVDEDENEDATIIVSDPTNFKLDSTGKLQVKAGATLNYEDKSIYIVTITATSMRPGQSAKTDTEVVNITVTEVDEPPVITKTGSLDTMEEENLTSARDTGLSFTFIDEDTTETATYSISDTTNFQIEVSTGKLQFKSGVDINYETKTAYTITLSASSTRTGGTEKTDSAVITISINNTDEPPVITKTGTSQNSINEGTLTIDTDTGFSFSAADEDENETAVMTFSDTTNFKIDSNSGKLQIKDGRQLDFERKSVYTVTITATSMRSGQTAMTDTETITISITNVDEPPEVRVSGSQINLLEGIYSSITYTGLNHIAQDPERANVTRTLTGDNRFQVAIDGKIQIKANASFDYRQTADRLITLTITATDQTSNSTIQTVVISISDVNYPPVITRGGTLAVLPEGNFATNTNTGYSYSATDLDDDSFNYTLSGSNNFQIATSGGNLQVIANTNLDFEDPTQRVHTITITVTDGVHSRTNTVTITISNVDEAPEISRTDSSNLNESTGSNGYLQNTSTGIDVIVTDPDAGDVPIITYSDNNFVINANTNRLEVKRGVVFDYENEAHRLHTITITATSRGKAARVTITVSVNNVKEGIILRSAVINTVELDTNQALNINLNNYIIYDSYQTGISYQLINPPSNWTDLTVNANNRILSGTPPRILTNQSLMLSIQVEQDDGTLTQTASIDSQVIFAIPIMLIRSNYNDVEDLILPNAFDAVISQSSGAVLARIASIRNNEVINPLGAEILTALKDNEAKINNGEANLYQILQDRNLALGFIGADANNSGIGLWTRFGFNSLKATENQITYEGSVNGVSAGVDYKYVNGGIIGLAYSNNSGEIDFSETDNTTTVTGVYDLNLNIIQPYYSNDFGEQEFWMSLGLGEGELELIKSSNNITSTSDLQLIASSLGFEASLLELNDSSIDFISELQLHRLNIKNNTERNYNKLNLKAGFGYTHDIELGQTSLVTADYGLAVVNRSTQGITETNAWGYEVFTNMEISSNEIPLQISGDLSYVAISSIDLRQISGGFAVSYRNPSTKLGSFIEVNPEFRSKEAIDIYDFAFSKDNDIDDSQLLLSSQLGYGFGVIGGVLTPYGDYSIAHDNSKYGLGVRYNQADQLTWSLGVNTENDQAQETKFGIEYKIIN